MRKNPALVATLVGLVGLFACGASVHTNTVHSFNHDMSQKSWTLVEDVGAPVVTSVANLELVPILTGNETWVSGEEMVSRAKSNGANLGQRDAEYLFAHQEEIPKEWRAYYLVFPGTKWRDSGGNRHVPYLYWDGYRWYLYFYYLDYNWRSDCRLVRPSK